MRRVVLGLSVAILCTGHSRSQTAAATPQNARQALIEMFFSKTPGTFIKHLPTATRTALEKSGALADTAAVFADGEPPADARAECEDV